MGKGILGDLVQPLLFAMLAVLGACTGSFLNVVAFRLPRECMSVVRPGSRCPRCAQPIPWSDNLPVLSWVLLLGRCRACGAPISPRYPAVELGTAGLFVLTAWMLLPEAAFRFPWDYAAGWLEAGVALLVTGALVALTLVDLDYRILPDEITKPGLVVAPVLAFLAPGLQPTVVTAGWWPQGGPRVAALLHGILGALASLAALWLVGWLASRAFRKEAMGMGDVKLMGCMGGLLGLWSFLALAVAAVAGAAVGILARMLTRNRYIPFGPFLALGTWVVMLRGEQVLQVYLGAFR